jgi:hypothetical protein
MQPVSSLMDNTRGQNKLNDRCFQNLSLLRCSTMSTAKELQQFRRIVVHPSSLLLLLDWFAMMRHYVVSKRRNCLPLDMA